MLEYIFIKTISSLISREIHPIEINPEHSYKEIGIRSHGRGIFHKNAVLGKTLGDKRVFKVIPNCIVFNIVFAWEQALAITTDNENGFVASHRFPMYSAKTGKIDLRYLRYYFLTKRGKADLELASPGGAGRNKTLGQKEFEKLKIKIHDFGSQQKIADILSTWDKSIEATEQLLENSKKRQKALMQNLLTGKKRLPGFSGSWRKQCLNNLAEIIVSPVDKKTVDGERDVLLCNYMDVYRNNYIMSTIEFMKATASEQEIIRFSIKKGDVLITKDSESPYDIAVPALVDEDLQGVVCGYHLTIIRPKESELDGAYLSFLLTTSKIRHYFFTLANGATRFGLSVGSIKNAEFLIPPLDEQIQISKILRVCDDEQDALSKRLENLKVEKKALMQQLFTGKKRIKVMEAA